MIQIFSGMRYSFSTILIIIFLGFQSQSEYVLAQSGGRSAYPFLNLTVSARSAAIGMPHVAAKDHDISLSIVNPSLITPNMDGSLALSYADYYAEISYGFAAYSHTFEKLGSFTASMLYLDYGTFTYADATGMTSGTFSAGDYAFQLGWARPLDSMFSIGANLKTIYSGLEAYSSYGLAADVGLTYHNEKRLLTLSFLARNIGRQLKAYIPGETEPLPFEMQLAASKRLEHMPLRFHFLLTNLQRFDLTYTDPGKPLVDQLTGEPLATNKVEDFLDKAMRHVLIGAELNPVPALSVRLGYNYLRRQEMKVNTHRSTVGFSWGLGIKVSKFQFDYARSAYHLAGSPNYITITTNLNDFLHKRTSGI